MTLLYKKIIGYVLVLLVAVATGFSIGKIYLNSNQAPAAASGVASDYMTPQNELESLYQQSLSKDVSSFNGIELYQIAQYKLGLVDQFKCVTLGEVNSTGQIVNMKSVKTKDANTICYYKMSPAKSVLGIQTPEICAKFAFNIKTAQTNISYGTFVSNGPNSEDLSAKFSGTGESWSKEKYIAQFKGTADQTILPYIISDKTCTGANATDLTDNQDGTYSFKINLEGHDVLKIAALCYAEEIKFSCGYESPSLQWDKVTITVTIDSDFMFKTIHYDESYTLYSNSIPVLKKAGVVDDFDSVYYYGADAVLDSEVIK